MSRAYPDRPLIGVGAVVIKAPQVLLIRRGKPPRAGSLSLPGGAQRLGETVADAVLREVHEETGVDAEILGLVDVVDSLNRDGDGRLEYHYTLIDLALRWTAGEPRAGGDAADAFWAPIKDLDGMDLWSETRRVIKLAAEMAEALPYES